MTYKIYMLSYTRYTTVFYILTGVVSCVIAGKYIPMICRQRVSATAVAMCFATTAASDYGQRGQRPLWRPRPRALRLDMTVAAAAAAAAASVVARRAFCGARVTVTDRMALLLCRRGRDGGGRLVGIFRGATWENDDLLRALAAAVFSISSADATAIVAATTTTTIITAYIIQPRNLFKKKNPRSLTNLISSPRAYISRMT